MRMLSSGIGQTLAERPAGAACLPCAGPAQSMSEGCLTQASDA